MSTTTAYAFGSKGLESTVPLASGELLISGYLTRWRELDHAGDRMVRGSFMKAIPAFLNGHAPLVYGHRLRDVLGKVLSLEEDEIGVKMSARVMRQPEGSPMRWVYDAIKDGYLKGLSAAAMWAKEPLPDGTRAIVGANGIVECSVTATPMLPSTSFEVISEGKALDMLGIDSLRDPSTGARDSVDRLELALLAREIEDVRSAITWRRLGAQARR